MDTRESFLDLDCNFQGQIERAELVVTLRSVSGCPAEGCRLAAAPAGDFAEGNGVSGTGATWLCPHDSDIGNHAVDCDRPLPGGGGAAEMDAVTVHNGQTGELRFDVTGVVTSGLFPRIQIAHDSIFGTVKIWSRESGAGARIAIENRAKPTDFSYPSRFVQVLDGTMHYVEAGAGERTILLIAGMPVYSYLWRNAMLDLSQVARVIVVDMIGQGLSSRLSPDVFDYQFESQARYLEAFIDALDLDDIIIVAHEVSSMPALHYAVTHKDRVAGVAWSEAWVRLCPRALEDAGLCVPDTIIPPPSIPLWEQCIFPDPYGCGFDFLITQGGFFGFLRSFFRVLPDPVVLDHYLSQYPTPTVEDSFPLIEFISKVPVGGYPPASAQLIDHYEAELMQWDVAKLMLVNDPGVLLWSPLQVDLARQRFPNLEVSCVGKAVHYAPETVPYNMAQRIIEWAATHSLL